MIIKFILVFVDYEGVRINASELVQRMKDLQNLSKKVIK